MVASPAIDQGMQAVSPWYWAVANELKLQSGTFGVHGHAYLRGLMEHPNQVGKKGAQMAFTEGPGVIKTLHSHIYGRIKVGTLYLFPTSDDVTEFSKARFNPLIEQNPCISQHVKSTDAANIKRVGQGMLYLRGARAQKKIQGNKRTSSRLKTISVDRIVFDERDEMDNDMVQLALERMSHSDVRETLTLSTPTIPEFGVDALYNKSDQRVWMIRCDHCGTETCMEIEFFNDPERVIRRGPDGKGIRTCKKCGREIHVWNADWRAQSPNVQDLVGWWISQLCSMKWDPWTIYQLYLNPPDGNLSEIMNSKLGMAYIDAENELTLQQVYACCGTKSMLELEQHAIKNRIPVAYGCDVQKDHLVMVLGHPVSEKTRRVIKVARVPSWNDVHDIAARFNTKAAVLDCEPETHKAREFQAAEPYHVWLCDYAENMKVRQKEDEKAGLVVVRRTEFLDGSHTLVAGMRLELPRRCEEVEVFAAQVCAAVKVLKEDEETGSKKYHYIRRDRDDYRHALTYFDLACEDPLVESAVIGEGAASDEEINRAYRRPEVHRPSEQGATYAGRDPRRAR
jgi:hypothetical protein